MKFFERILTQTPAEEPTLRKVWDILMTRFMEARRYFVEKEEKRMRKQVLVDLIRSCRSQMENAVAVGRREGRVKGGVAGDILRSCMEEMERAVEMIKEI